MEPGISVHLRILLILYTMWQIPLIYGKVNSWCGIIDYALVDLNYTTVHATTNQKLCYQACLNDSPRCKSANYRPEDRECDLNCASHYDVCVGGRLVENPGSIYTYTTSKMGCDTPLDSTSAAHCNKTSVPPCYTHKGSAWQMVFKGVAGTGLKMYDQWTNATWLGDLGFFGNYRNDTLYNAWNNGQIHVKRVKLSLYDQSGVKVEMVFNGRDSDISSWFAKERLVSSPWSDLTPTAQTNFFSIYGLFWDRSAYRSFYISRHFDLCPNDTGWLMVVDAATGVCDYELGLAMGYPAILYSTENHAVRWHGGLNDGTLGAADYLTVHIDIE